MRPFLMACGGGFQPGASVASATSPIDIAPTLLAHLGLPAIGCDGRAISPSER
jgi:arylsulfatase A-like enzyme